MKRFSKELLAVFSVLILLSFGVLAIADEGMNKEQKFEGKLISVDMDTQSFVAEDSDGNKVEFAYNDDTKIIGAGGTVEGLTGETGKSVTVLYKMENGKKIAEEVNIKPEQTY